MIDAGFFPHEELSQSSKTPRNIIIYKSTMIQSGTYTTKPKITHKAINLAYFCRGPYDIKYLQGS